MIPKIAALCMLLAITGFLLSEMGFRGKGPFVLLSSVIILTSFVSELGTVFSDITEIFENAGADGAARSALKIVGLGYVFGISSEVAEELGESGTSKLLTLFGRVEIFALTLPYVNNIIELGVSLIK